MRRNALNGAQRATSGASREVYSARTPFICASCLSTSTSQRISRVKPRPFQQSSFSTISSRRRNAQSVENAGAGQREFVVPQTHYDFFPSTFPAGPPPDSPFTPDLRELRKEFLQLQAKNHPDLAPSSQKRHAEAVSARINEAYKTLQDPLRRAQYLLSMHGIDVEDESGKLGEGGGDGALLMEVMEAREAVEEVEDEEGLTTLKEENAVRIADSVKELEGCFERGDLEKAASEAVRLRYWVNIEESIQGWEKGKGGGILHH